MSVAEQFAANVVRHRNLLGISQEELSFRAELHRTAIGMIERGVRTARIDTLLKLAGALEVEPADLLAGMAWQPGEITRGSFAGSYAVDDG